MTRPIELDQGGRDNKRETRAKPVGEGNFLLPPSSFCCLQRIPPVVSYFTAKASNDPALGFPPRLPIVDPTE